MAEDSLGESHLMLSNSHVSEPLCLHEPLAGRHFVNRDAEGYFWAPRRMLKSYKI